MVEEAGREAHLSAQQPAPSQAARIPPSHGHPRRSQRVAVASAQGSPAPVGLIWRIRDRRTFLELRRHGIRARRGPVTVTFLAAVGPAVDDPPRVAFAVPRKVGPAVVRNRLRRSVRARLVIRQQRSPAAMQPGAYLVSLHPDAADLGGPGVADLVERCLDRLQARS